ncbi:hypothetical protein IQ279_08440 [Streptomyces verrucosisporus]|nr:hypothetical protein [Streptomyces verrucosisporus]MBN3929665.1 hypothetical protein [Streptomyces verrucosisporus]
MVWAVVLLVAVVLAVLGWSVPALGRLLVVAAVLLAVGPVNGWERWRT